ncbi:MAG TPA: hypothetical protein VFM46_01840 [Pseudomonadales bacterium]|nr:hypothetical protein [Pseudomonadales bacterium]
MKRMYYLADTLEAVERVWNNVRYINISAGSFHIVSQDSDGIQRHQLSPAGAVRQTDIIHSSEQGALIGATVGVLFAIWLMVVKPFDLQVGMTGFIVAVVMFLAFGAWAGGLIGLSHMNYKIAPFRKAVEEGKYLLMIDVGTIQQENLLRMLMRLKHPDVIYEGGDSLFINPFEMKTTFQPLHPV